MALVPFNNWIKIVLMLWILLPWKRLPLVPHLLAHQGRGTSSTIPAQLHIPGNILLTALSWRRAEQMRSSQLGNSCRCLERSFAMESLPPATSESRASTSRKRFCGGAGISIRGCRTVLERGRSHNGMAWVFTWHPELLFELEIVRGSRKINTGPFANSNAILLIAYS